MKWPTIIQFPNFDLLPATHAMDSQGPLTSNSSRHEHRTYEDVFNLLSSVMYPLTVLRQRGSNSRPSDRVSCTHYQFDPGWTCKTNSNNNATKTYRKGHQRVHVPFESIKIFRVKIDWNCNFVGLLHHPFLTLACFWHFLGINFQLFIKILCSAKDHWRGLTHC